MDVDKEATMLYSSYGPQTHPIGLDNQPHLSALAPAETGSGPQVFGAPHALPLTDPTTPFSFGLYGLYAPSQMEAILISPQTSSYKQVSGCHRLAATMR